MTTSNIMFALITGSACCVLIGVIMTAVRLARLIRKERTLTNKIQSFWQLNESESHAAGNDSKRSPEASV